MKSALVLSFALAALAPGVTAAVTETFKQSYPLDPQGTVSLENVNGDIEIVAWDRPEVSLEAEKKGKTADDLTKVTLEIETSPAKLSIKTKYAKSGWFGSVHASVHYRLQVPVGARLEKIDTVNSAITVAGVRGPVNLDTVNGSIKATGLAADARLDSVNGSLEAEFVALDQVKKVKLDSVNGSADVTLPKGAGARIEAGSVNGRVNVAQPIQLSKNRRSSLAGQIGTGGPEIILDTVNGSISIKEK